MIDILYVLGQGSQWENRELRYSLRSVCRFATGVSRVFVVGHDPGFLKDAQVFPVADTSNNKEYNIAAMIAWASKNTDISEDFLMLNDDHFLIAPIHAPAYPLYQVGLLEDRIPKVVSAQYRASLVNTREHLLKAGKPTMSFEPHTPITFNRSHFLQLTPVWEESRIRRAGYVARSIYCNYLGLVGTTIADVKLRKPKGPEDVAKRVAGRDVFSISDSSIELGVASFLEQLFPEKCRFEA
jgi:hypothetical protein